MNDLQNAAESVSRLSRLLKGLPELGDALTRLGSLEQAEAEANARIAAANEKETAARERAIAIERDTDDAIEAAKRLADSTVAKATEDAKAIVAAARGQAAKVAADAQVELEAIAAKVKATNAKVDAAEKRLADITAKGDKEAELLLALEDRIAKAREAAKALIEG